MNRALFAIFAILVACGGSDDTASDNGAGAGAAPADRIIRTSAQFRLVHTYPKVEELLQPGEEPNLGDFDSTKTVDLSLDETGTLHYFVGYNDSGLNTGLDKRYAYQGSVDATTGAAKTPPTRKTGAVGGLMFFPGTGVLDPVTNFFHWNNRGYASVSAPEYVGGAQNQWVYELDAKAFDKTGSPSGALTRTSRVVDDGLTLSPDRILAAGMLPLGDAGDAALFTATKTRATVEALDGSFSVGADAAQSAGPTLVRARESRDKKRVAILAMTPGSEKDKNLVETWLFDKAARTLTRVIASAATTGYVVAQGADLDLDEDGNIWYLATTNGQAPYTLRSLTAAGDKLIAADFLLVYTDFYVRTSDHRLFFAAEREIFEVQPTP